MWNAIEYDNCYLDEMLQMTVEQKVIKNFDCGAIRDVLDLS